MVYKLALFPLQTVVFPGENLPLHIFEERYKQLITDCQKSGMTFGIPIYIDKSLDYGTEIELVRVANTYSSGAKDIVCKGLRVFRIKDFYPQLESKTYAGGDVEFLEDDKEYDEVQKKQLIDLISELYLHLEVPAPNLEYDTFNSYTLSHKIGLSLLQEYNLLKLTSERERQAFLINHLCITIPIVQELNRTKNNIELNGAFRNYDPLDFREFRLTKS